MSHTTAPSCNNSDDVYDDTCETAVKKFAMAENVCYKGTKALPKDSNQERGPNSKKIFLMAENVCYEGIKSLPKEDSAGINEAKGINSNKVFLILSVLVMALLLGTVCACISFAVEISNLRSRIASLQTASSQQSHALETNTENLTQQISTISQQLITSTTQQLNTTIQDLSDDLHSHIQTVDSCSALPPSSPSGYYWVGAHQQAERVYCDFNKQCGCGGPSTWTRVAFLNMSDPDKTCPNNWVTYTSPVRACGNAASGCHGCDSVTYSTLGLTYSRVCGRIIAHQHGDTVAFYSLARLNTTIEEAYLDGVSITHGGVGSRQHIWSFASALGDAYSYTALYSCSCSGSSDWPLSTSFVGDDYFCDTGFHGSISGPFDASFFGDDDPLWDGAGCDRSSTCCTFNNPPWFCKTLPQPTTDDLEVRICDSILVHRDTPIKLLEIYVQ